MGSCFDQSTYKLRKLSMNLIFVGKPFNRPRTLELGRRSVQVKLGLALAGVLSLVIGASFMLGQWVGDMKGLSRTQLTDLRESLQSQAAALDQTEQEAQRNLDALALELGQLQAHAARLNALGSRLTKIGKLEDGEFDFAASPAIGGPETDDVGQLSYLSSDFGSAVARLRQQFDQQDQQLGLLESLLLDRDLDQSLVPKGMPVRSGYVSSPFGHRADPFSGRFTMHSGVDFAGPYGSDVFSVAAGVVTWAGIRPGYGKVIEIDHGNGYKTRYAHNSKNVVAVGERVHAGDLVAKMGTTGRSTGAHVHFEVWYEGRPVNPRDFVSAIR
jgi:murein DD-endopeptidase MepM/ murein hydrolase activator NlpD